MSDSDTPLLVVNLGCKVNRVESDSFLAELLASGFSLAGPDEQARIVIVNTCTVTAEADAKSRKAIRHALRANPAADVVVTGCAAAIAQQELSALDERVTVEPDRLRVCALARRLCDVPEAAGHASTEGKGTFRRAGAGFRSRVGIKVQDGCANACTYCIVHVARNRIWAKPADEVVAEVCAAEAAGVEEVVLTGINLGSRHDLSELVARLLSATSLLRIRLSSIEPHDVDESLIELMASAQGRVCRHLHVPLQSGCDETLREMARPYDTAFFSSLAGRLRRAIPDIAITTDVIAGFPGETDEQFEESRAFCEKMGFSKMHVFRYSRREGTPAADRSDQVPAQVKASRSHALRELSARMREDFAARLVGNHETLLLESAGGATSERYLPALDERGSAFSQAERTSMLVPVEVVGTQGETLLCREISRS
jgi:threonylcarbamoyladenosine tRNA methylthiotransferase MtaB